MSDRRSDQEIDDQAAQDALRYGGKSGPVPTHDAMQRSEQDPDADATDVSENDDYDFDEDKERY
jgi:hypothetical protein